MSLKIRSKEGCLWDLVALGEVMLRFDPGDRRIATTRSFQVSEGGGEYNVARGLKRCFGLNTAIVTAFAENPVGSLLLDLIYQGGVGSVADPVGEVRRHRPHGSQRVELYRARVRLARTGGLLRSRP